MEIILQLIQFFLILILNSMFICGLHYAFSYDIIYPYELVPNDCEMVNKQILWKVQFLAKKYLGEFWSKPFGGCMICMSLLWSLPIFMYFYPLSFEILWLNYDHFLLPLPIVNNFGVFIIYVLSLAGINRIVIRWL